MLCFSVWPDSNGTRRSVPVFTDRPAVVFWRWELINFRMIMLCHIQVSSLRDGARRLCPTYSCFGMEVGVECSFFPSRGCLLQSRRLLWDRPWVSGEPVCAQRQYLMSGANVESTCT